METVGEILARCGAILKGHFVLTGTEHSDTYIEKVYLYQNPTVFEDLCWEIAQEVSTKPIKIDAVAGPAPIGAVLAWRVAYYLGEILQKEVIPFFTEKDKEGRHVFRKSFQKSLAGKNVLIVDDVLTTGGSIRELLKAVTLLRGQAVAVAVICNRGGLGPESFYGLPVISLLKMKLKTWLEKNCPLCQANIPIDAKF